MNVLQGVIGKQLHIPLFNSALSTSQTLADFTVDASINGSYISAPFTSLSAALTEIDQSNFAKAYSLRIIPDQIGDLFITLYNGGYEESFLVQVQSVDISNINSSLYGTIADYVFTVDDGSSSLEGATVRLYNSAETALYLVLTSDIEGKVYFSVPPADYKIRINKTGYTFNNPVSITVCANSTATPIVEEIVPTTVAAGGTLVVKGEYFSSTAEVLFGVTAVSITAASNDGEAVIVSVPSDLTTSSIVRVRKPDPDNLGSYLTSTTSLTLVIS
jgi:hypothetical protein